MDLFNEFRFPFNQLRGNYAVDPVGADLAQSCVDFSLFLHTWIINKNLNPDDQKALVEETLNKVRTVQ